MEICAKKMLILAFLNCYIPMEIYYNTVHDRFYIIQNDN